VIGVPLPPEPPLRSSVGTVKCSETAAISLHYSITGTKECGGRRIEISTSRLLNLTLNQGLHELKNCCVILENKGNNRVEMVTNVPSVV
jgi:hypothetical protein